MPELPEVETIRRQLEKVLVNQEIVGVNVLSNKTFSGNSKLMFGKRILGVVRRGKALVIEIGGGVVEYGLLIHLKMTGQLIYESSGGKDRVVGGHPTKDFVSNLPSSHTRVVWEFEDLSKLFFNDQRLFGWVKLVRWEEVDNEKFFLRLGKEPWGMSDDEFRKILNSSKSIKVRLMDQDKMAGVGNIYANDALWEAGIDPRRSAKSLNAKEAKSLRACVIKVLDEGIMYGGATAMDKKYVNLDGLGGTYQDHFRVYQREGERCLRVGCSGKIKKTMIGGRGTFYCPICQR